MTHVSPHEAAVFVCSRTADLAEPHVPSVLGACTNCHEQVWISVTTDNQLKDRPGSRIICTVCAAALMSVDPSIDVGVLPETATEVRTYLRQQL